VFWLWEKPKVAGSQLWTAGVLTDLGNVMFFQKEKNTCTRIVQWAGELVQFF